METQKETLILKTENREIVEFCAFETDLAEYKSQYKDAVYDMTDKEQEAQAKKDKLAIGKTIASLDRVHKEIKSPLRERVDLLDGERKRIKDGLLEIQGHIKKQIEAHYAAIEAEEEKLLAKLESIRELCVFIEFSLSSELIKSRLSKLESVVIDDANFSYYKEEANFAKAKTLTTLENLLLETEKQEHEKAELETLKREKAEWEQKERDAQIAQEAVEKAELAMQMERENWARLAAEAKKEAEEKANLEKAVKEAEENAKQIAAKLAQMKKDEQDELAQQRMMEAGAFEEEKAGAKKEQRAMAQLMRDEESRLSEQMQRMNEEAGAFEEEKAGAKKEQSAMAQWMRHEESRLSEQMQRMNEEARAIDPNHQKKAQAKVISDIVKFCDLNYKTAEKVTKAISEGQICYVKIIY